LSSILEGTRKKFHNSQITAARFFLASFVIFVHLFPWYSFCSAYNFYIINKLNKFIVSVFQKGGETNPAVLAFIILSGYCIHRNGLRDNEITLPHMKKFFKRRFFRIMPVYFLGIILGVTGFFCFSTNCSKLITATTEISVAALLGKVFALHALCPLNFSDYYCGNGPLVTVGTEIWLYLTYPLGLFLIKKFGQSAFIKSLAIILISGIVLCSVFPSFKGWWHNGSLFGFLPYWWIGVFFVNPPSLSSFYKKRFFGFFFLITMVYFVISKNPFVVEIRKLLLGILIGYFLNKIDTPRPQLLSQYPAFLSNLMESSYSLYAIHTPIIVFFLFHQYNPFLCLSAIYLSAYLIYITYERPLTLQGRGSNAS
jgi:peptidoglycan/LPS O-acetylase OafA/YrhL